MEIFPQIGDNRREDLNKSLKPPAIQVAKVQWEWPTLPPPFLNNQKLHHPFSFTPQQKHVWSPIFGMHAASETFRIRMIRS